MRNAPLASSEGTTPSRLRATIARSTAQPAAKHRITRTSSTHPDGVDSAFSTRSKLSGASTREVYIEGRSVALDDRGEEPVAAVRVGRELQQRPGVERDLHPRELLRGVDGVKVGMRGEERQDDVLVLVG